jgi:hypothetical protein
MHPFVHRKDVPIKDYSRHCKVLQGVERTFFRKFASFLMVLLKKMLERGAAPLLPRMQSHVTVLQQRQLPGSAWQENNSGYLQLGRSL